MSDFLFLSYPSSSFSINSFALSCSYRLSFMDFMVFHIWICDKAEGRSKIAFFSLVPVSGTFIFLFSFNSRRIVSTWFLLLRNLPMLPIFFTIHFEFINHFRISPLSYHSKAKLTWHQHVLMHTVERSFFYFPLYILVCCRYIRLILRLNMKV